MPPAKPRVPGEPLDSTDDTLDLETSGSTQGQTEGAAEIDKDAEIAALRKQLEEANAALADKPKNPNDDAPDPLSATALSEKDEQIAALRTELAATRAKLPQHRNADDANLPPQSEFRGKELQRAQLTKDGWLAPNVKAPRPGL